MYYNASGRTAIAVSIRWFFSALSNLISLDDKKQNDLPLGMIQIEISLEPITL